MRKDLVNVCGILRPLIFIWLARVAANDVKHRAEVFIAVEFVREHLYRAGSFVYIICLDMEETIDYIFVYCHAFVLNWQYDVILES